MTFLTELFKKNKNFKDISKTFHYTGKHVEQLKIKKSLYLYQSLKNLCSFNVNDFVKHWIGSLANYKGGIIVFNTETSIEEINNAKILSHIYHILNLYKGKILRNPTDNSLSNISIGNKFFGEYKINEKINFDKTSFTIEINGISTQVLITICEKIISIFPQFIVKNLNNKKVYLFIKNMTN